MTTNLRTNRRPILARSIASRLALPLASAIAALLASPSLHAQTVRSWTGATGGAWLTTTNWSPSGTFAGGAPLANPAGEGADTDIMSVAAANAATNVGINMNTLTAAGGVGLILGGIDFNKTNTATLQIGNSSTAVNGILQLNGATINAVPNTLIRVVGSANLTIANVNTGTTSQTMGLRLGTTNGIFEIGAGRTLTISSIISQAAANTGFTKTGTGILTLSGANTYDGVTTLTAGTLSINSFTNGGVASSLGMASNASANLVMTGGTLSYTGGGASTDRGMTFGALTGNPIISVTNAAANLNLTNTIVGTAGQQIDFTKGGTGTLTLSNDNNSYIGRTFVSGGTLAVTSISAVAAGNSSIGVATSAANGLISIGTGATTTTLSYIGTGNITDRNLDLPGTTGGAIISQSGAGLLKFTGAFGATGAGIKTLTLTGSTAGTGEIASAIVDNSVTNTTSLTKNGTGTWTLSGANTYTGTTTVSGGTLDLGGGTANGSLASPTLTLAGGTLSYTRTGNTTQGFTTTNINGASQISVVSGNTLNLGTVVRGAGGSVDFSTTGAGTVAALAASNVNGIMPGFSFGNTWAVANGAGVAISGLGSYTLTSVAGTTGTNYVNGNIDVDNNAGPLDAAITANSLRFSSAAANTLTLAAGLNTLSAGSILVGSAVGSNLSTITGGTLTGAANQSLAIVQNNTSGGLTISSTIVNNTSTSVTKSGAGLLTIDSANTYTGGTTVAAGTLKLSGAGTLGPAAASVAVSSGAVLDLNGTNQSITLAAGNGVGTVANNSGSGTSVLTLTATAVTDAGFLTIADSTSTPGGKVAVIVANNMQIPSNLNSYSGGTTVNAGAFFYLNFASPSGAGTGLISLPASGATTSVSSGLLVDGGATYANDVSGAGYVHNNSGSAAIATLTGNLNTSGNFNVRVAGAGFNFAGSGNSTLSGIIGPVGASGVFGPNATVAGANIIKSGTGTLTLSGANAYTGTTTVNGGTLRVSGGGAIPNAGLVTLADASGATLQVVAGETIGALAGGGATGGAVSIDAAQTLTLTSGTQTYAGTISGAGTLTITGAVQTLNGALSQTGGVNVTSGVLTLGNSSNSYSGATIISAGAGLIVTANGALSTTGAGNETTVTGAGAGNGAALGLSGGINYSTTEKIIGSGAGHTTGTLTGFAVANRGFIQSLSGNNTFAGDIELSGIGTSRIGTQDGAQLTLSGAITQGAGITTANILFRVGNLAGDFVTLANAGNSFGGDSTVFTGLTGPGFAGVRLGINNALPTNLTISSFSGTGAGAALDLAGFNQSLNGLITGTGAGSLSIINMNTGTPSTLTLNPTATKTTSNTLILGGGGLGIIDLVKDGAFTQTLASANTYTGTTTVNAGTLLVTGSLSGTSGVTVNSSGTLGGNGTIGGATTVANGGILSPGTSAGTLTFGNGLNLSAVNSASSLVFELGTSSDLVVLSSGALNIGTGTLGFSDFAFSDSGGLALGTYTLFDTTTTITGSLDLADLSGAIGAFTGTLSLANSDTDVVLTVVPEPTSAVLLGLGALGLLRRRRSKR